MNVTEAPGTGLNELLFAGALYNCAVIVIVVPRRFIPIVSLYNAEIEVIVPSTGTENAKSSIGPNIVPVQVNCWTRLKCDI